MDKRQRKELFEEFSELNDWDQILLILEACGKRIRRWFINIPQRWAMWQMGKKP